MRVDSDQTGVERGRVTSGLAGLGLRRLPTLHARLVRSTTVLRRILGMPDYAAYLAHHRARHPDCPVPTEREYYDQYVVNRYGAGASRCC